MRVVIDADCVIAGTLAGAGAAADLLALWRRGAFELIACPHLLEEVRKILTDSLISKRYGIGSDDTDEFCRRFQEESLWFPDAEEPPSVVPKDPGDDYLVALALSARADILVLRDRHLDGVSIAGLEILPPREALRRLRSQSPE